MTLEKSSVVGARPGLEAARGEPPLRVGAERRRLAGGPAVRVPRVADDVRANGCQPGLGVGLRVEGRVRLVREAIWPHVARLVSARRECPNAPEPSSGALLVRRAKASSAGGPSTLTASGRPLVTTVGPVYGVLAESSQTGIDGLLEVGVGTFGVQALACGAHVAALGWPAIPWASRACRAGRRSVVRSRPALSRPSPHRVRRRRRCRRGPRRHPAPP